LIRKESADNCRERQALRGEVPIRDLIEAGRR
jgi:hypothetical protein